MARKTIAERIDAVSDMVSEVTRLRKEIAALRRMPNSPATVLLIKAAEALLKHLIRIGVKRLILRRKKKP